VGVHVSAYEETDIAEVLFALVTLRAVDLDEVVAKVTPEVH
jgi:hypothetical protein